MFECCRPCVQFRLSCCFCVLQSFNSQSPPDVRVARSVASTSATVTVTGTDLADFEQSPASESSLGWHKRAVSDMRKLAGEVSIDNMGGAAQRVGVEMNVAAKKISGEVNDAAKKLQGLLGRTGTRLGISKIGEQGKVATHDVREVHGLSMCCSSWRSMWTGCHESIAPSFVIDGGRDEWL